MASIDNNDSIIPEVPDPVDSDTCEKSGSELLDSIKELKSKLAATEAELQKMNHEKDITMEKYTNLTCLLRSSLECPVCLEVPLTGPFPQCKNGHLVCANCKRTACPICRVEMAEEKNLLAAKLLDKLEHICKHKGCNESFSRDDLEVHMKACSYRKIKCPAPSEDCGVEVPFCHLLDHILNECDGSDNKSYLDGKVGLVKTLPIVESFKYDMDGNFEYEGRAYQWQERFFYTTAEKGDGGALVFNILYLGEKSECDDITVEITMTKCGEENSFGKPKNSVKLVGQPLLVDLAENERKKNGLIVGISQLEKIATHINDGYTFDVIYNIY